MKEVKRYECDFCRIIRATLKGIETHEKICVHNPNTLNCYRCAYAYEGEIYSYEGYPTGRNGPMCAYSEDLISENMAHTGEHDKISSELYHYRQTCPEI